MNSLSFIKPMLLGITAICVLLIILLLIAGRSDYWQAWIFAAVNMGIMIILFSAFREKIGIIRERMHPGVGTKWWDKLFWMIYGPMNLAIIVVAALDAGRYFWSPQFSPAVYVIGYITYLFANIAHLWAIISNDFYTSTVRLQEERGQVVIDSGPYRLVRHPGYFGISLMLFSIALLLGSVWAMIPFSIVFLLIVIRTTLEDKTLKNELPGYKDYAQKTRYRLIPGIW
jgi:protein-S-isoprenylcysteine O-methyltransferase Ste14